MYADLAPEWIGLIITPLAVVGAIVLLGTNRSIPNVLAFAGGFALAYSIMSVIVLWIGSIATGADPNSDTRYVVSVVIGLLFLAGGAAVFIKPHPDQDEGPPRWSVALQTATPPKAFAGGTALSLVNPNVAILLSGLTIIITSGVTMGTQIVGAITLVLGSLIPFAIPIAIFLIMGDRGKTLLQKTFAWMVEHQHVLSGGTLLFFGAIFLGRGLGGLM